MNWKYEAIDRLKTYELKKNAVQAIPAQIRELEQQFGAIRSSTSDGEPVQGSGGRSEDALINNIAKREELKRTLAITEQSVDTVEHGLSLLTDEEYEILDAFYIHPTKCVVMDMCDRLSCEQATVYRRRNEALRRFTLALYGMQEV